MMIGTLQVEMLLPGAFSLKDKRFVLQSLKQKIRSGFNVSVAEVDYQEKWQRSVLAFACVSAERKGIDSLFERLMNALDSETRVEVVDRRVEVW
jgi:uncharacterized protein YlxP (DUF503 family)